MNVAMTRMVLPQVSLVLEPVEPSATGNSLSKAIRPLRDEAVGGVDHAGG